MTAPPIFQTPDTPEFALEEIDFEAHDLDSTDNPYADDGDFYQD